MEDREKTLREADEELWLKIVDMNEGAELSEAEWEEVARRAMRRVRDYLRGRWRC